MTLTAWVALTLAGGAGSLARYAVDALVAFRAHERFPYGILVVNVSGAFVLGFLTAFSAHGPVLRVVEVGFVGAFTTFSAWMLDTHRLGEDERRRAAVLNVGVSLVLGLGAAALGRLLGHAL